MGISNWVKFLLIKIAAYVVLTCCAETETCCVYAVVKKETVASSLPRIYTRHPPPPKAAALASSEKQCFFFLVHHHVEFWCNPLLSRPSPPARESRLFLSPHHTQASGRHLVAVLGAGPPPSPADTLPWRRPRQGGGLRFSSLSLSTSMLPSPPFRAQCLLPTYRRSSMNRKRT